MKCHEKWKWLSVLTLLTRGKSFFWLVNWSLPETAWIGILLALVILSVNYTLVLYFVRAYYTRSVAIHTPKQTLTQGRRTSIKKLHMR